MVTIEISQWFARSYTAQISIGKRGKESGVVKRCTNQEWQTLFEQYENSNMTQRVFCEQNGLSLSTFFSKRRRLQTATPSASVDFIRAEVETNRQHDSKRPMNRLR
ncbi:IS66 family insertion sequence element accessory protein TnpA [Vibrio echinoideorum]|uniref:IS66 family insertion sequence element accessory protein TnpA n=1 Tax=Vibrio echinoideorum TaxID=2100116 RepID=UPI003C728A05